MGVPIIKPWGAHFMSIFSVFSVMGYKEKKVVWPHKTISAGARNHLHFFTFMNMIP